jgi:hypothetical protein
VRISHRRGNLRRLAALLVDNDAVPAIGDGEGDEDGMQQRAVRSET